MMRFLLKGLVVLALGQGLQQIAYAEEAHAMAPELVPFAGPIHLPPVERPHVPASATKRAERVWRHERKAYERGFHNGQCVEVAVERRPDVLARIVIVKDAEAYANGEAAPDILEWNAEAWDTYAAEVGIRVSATPRPGALMVFHDPEYGGPGHIAYVHAVANGSVTVYETHAPNLYERVEQTWTQAELAGVNVDYIY